MSLVSRTAGYALVAIVAALLVACSDASSPSPTPSATAPSATFASAACPVSPPGGQELHCGYLTVPENRTRSDSKTIKLAVAIIKSTNANPEPDAMLYLSGGPGQPALSNNMQAFDVVFAEPIQRERDLVFFDQRGTGASVPSLFCQEEQEAFIASLAQDITNAAQNEGSNAVLRACHDRLAEDGIDFTGYNSAESAADIADLMRLLGYDSYNIYGVSYGTRLALEAMRTDPEHIRSVVIDSTLPPDTRDGAERSWTFQRAIETLVSACKADAACNGAYPDLEETYFDLVGEADAHPITVQPKNPANGESATVVVNRDRILSGTFQAFYDTSLLRVLPFAAHAIAGGNTAILDQIAQQVAFADIDIAGVMQTAVRCNDVTMSLMPDDVAAATDGVRDEILAAHIGIADADDLESEQDLCRAFGIDETTQGSTDPVTSDIPTLILAGEYDPVTPPEWGKRAGETLSHSYFFEFPGSGHGELFGRHDCAIELTAAFFEDPEQSPDAACVRGLSEPDFVTP